MKLFVIELFEFLAAEVQYGEQHSPLLLEKLILLILLTYFLSEDAFNVNTKTATKSNIHAKQEQQKRKVNQRVVTMVLSSSGDNPSENVKLEGGTTEAEGRVMVKHNDVWGSVCDDRWGQADAAVVCRMLCYQ